MWWGFGKLDVDLLSEAVRMTRYSRGNNINYVLQEGCGIVCGDLSSDLGYVLYFTVKVNLTLVGRPLQDTFIL